MNTAGWIREAIIVLVICGCVTGRSRAGVEPSTTAVITGEEQKAVEEHVSDWNRPEAGDFGNVLDFVQTVLVQRGDPTPDPAELRRRAVQAMGKALFEQIGKKDSKAEKALHSAWLDQAIESGSFASVIRDSSWPDEEARQKGIDAGIKAMLPSGTWLLSRDQAGPIRKMMAAREQDAAEGPEAPASFVMKRLQEGVIYLRIPTFENATIGRRIVEGLHKELKAGADGVLIDLRDNPGGRPEQANAVADVFLDRQTLQIMWFQDGRLVKIVSRPGASAVPVAVLVNRNTGSAAEMLAMALRDNDRGILLGERTGGTLFGKDAVDLPNGRMLVFRCEPTILSPSKTNYAVRGIPPHKVIDANQSATDAVVRQGLQVFRADREHSERNAGRIDQENNP